MNKPNEPEEPKKKALLANLQSPDGIKEKKENGEREHRVPTVSLPIYDTRKNMQLLQENAGWEETKVKPGAPATPAPAGNGSPTEPAVAAGNGPKSEPSVFGEIKAKMQIAGNPVGKDLARFEETRRTILFKEPVTEENKIKPVTTARAQGSVEISKVKTQVFNLALNKEETRRAPSSDKGNDAQTPTARVTPIPAPGEIIRNKPLMFNLSISKEVIKKEEPKREATLSTTTPPHGMAPKSKTMIMPQAPRFLETLGNKPEPPIAAEPVLTSPPVETANTEENEGARIVFSIRDRGVIAAAIMPKVGKDKALEYFDLNYKAVLPRISTYWNNYVQQLYYVVQQIQTLMELAPYSPQASQIVDALGAFDIYQYFSTMMQNGQRFSEAVYLLACMNRDNSRLSQLINIEHLRNVNSNLFPGHKTKFYRRIADIFSNFSAQDFLFMNLRDRSVIIAALLPMLGVEKVSKYFKTIFKPFVNQSITGQNELAGRLRFINSMMQKLVLLPPFCDEAKRLTGQMFGCETYMFFQAARQNQQRFAEAAYLLCRLNLSNLPLFRFVNIERVLYPEQPLFPEDYTKLFRRESDLWDSLPKDFQEI